MSDTHGVNGEGWIGFDLDGTLAKYDGWQGIDHIGEPIGPMVDLMKKLHGQGRYVKIVTARVAPQKLEDGTFGEPFITVPQGDGGATRQYASQYIQDWCHFNLGFVPEIVYQKDCRMLELYDDRVKQVVPNKGVLVEDLANRIAAAKKELKETILGFCNIFTLVYPPDDKDCPVVLMGAFLNMCDALGIEQVKIGGGK